MVWTGHETGYRQNAGNVMFHGPLVVCALRTNSWYWFRSRGWCERATKQDTDTIPIIIAYRTRWKTDVLVEMYHVLHSTAYKWYNAMCYNTMMQQVIESRHLSLTGQQVMLFVLCIGWDVSCSTQYRIQVVQCHVL